jgi:hypothetical protein
MSMTEETRHSLRTPRQIAGGAEMKRKSLELALLLLLGSAVPAFAGGLEIEWAKCYGGRDSDSADSIFQIADDGYIVGATSMSKDGHVRGNHGSRDFWVFKIDARGDMLWQRTLGGSRYDGGGEMTVLPTKDGGFIMAGQTDSNDGDVSGSRERDNYDVWIVRLDKEGNIQWEKSYGGYGMDFAEAIDEAADGGYILAVNSDSPWYGDPEDGFADGFFVVKLDESGNIVWRKNIGEKKVSSLRQTADGGCVLAGNILNTGGTDCWAVKLNPDGDIEWQKTFGGTGEDSAEAIRQTSDGGYIVAGSSNSIDGDVSGVHGVKEVLEKMKTMTEEEKEYVFFPTDFWIVKLNASGDIVWQRALGGSDDECAHCVLQTGDGGFVVGGTANSSDGDVIGHHGNNAEDFWLVKLGSSGNLLWQKTLGGTGSDFLWGELSIAQTNDGGYVAAGSTRSSNGDVSGYNGGGVNTDVWIVKLAPESDASTDKPAKPERR